MRLFLIKTVTVLFVSSIISGCTIWTDKKDIKPQIPAHCIDGIQNNGELDVDCGGECKSCGVIAASCQIDTNRLFLTNPLVIPFQASTETVMLGSGSFDGQTYDVLGSTSSGYDFDFRFSGNRQPVSRAYILGGDTYYDSFFSDSHAVIHMGMPAGDISSISGKLFVTQLPNGKLMISFCDATFALESSSGPTTIVYNSIKGRAVCAN
jgi:hypothetical protein